MTPNEMAREYRQILDKELSYSAPHFEDAEISITLSQALDEYIKRYYNDEGNKYGEGFENSEKRRKDLSQLVKGVYISYNTTTNIYTITYQNGVTEEIGDLNNFFSDSSIIKPNGSLWKLPKDLLWVISEELTWSTENTCFPSTRRIPIKPITHDEYNQLIDNSFKKPYEKLVWRLDYGREFNTNTTTLRTTGNNLWYKVIVPSLTDDPANYGIVVNNTIYLASLGAGTFSSQDVVDELVSSMGIDEVYYQFDSILYVQSNVQVNVLAGPTNQIEIELKSYMPSDNSRYIDQNYLSTDYRVHELITHGWNIDKYYLRYIRRPRSIRVDNTTPTNQVYCELDESTHSEIIQIAVTKTLTTLQDPRLQAQIMQEQKSE